MRTAGGQVPVAPTLKMQMIEARRRHPGAHANTSAGDPHMTPETAYVLDGIRCEPLRFTAPLDHARPGGETVPLFARSLRRNEASSADLPWLLFLQGGPGFGSPRPTAESGWIKRALRDFRVLLLDQRGTGRPVP
jgi:hypothetical protein